MTMNIIASRRMKGSFINLYIRNREGTLYKAAVSLCLLRTRDLSGVVSPVIHEIRCYRGKTPDIFRRNSFLCHHICLRSEPRLDFKMTAAWLCSIPFFFSCRVLVTLRHYMAEVPIMLKTISNQSINLDRLVVLEKKLKAGDDLEFLPPGKIGGV